MIEPEWKGFRRAPDGTLCWNGFTVFGHILPRIGVWQFPCGSDGQPADDIGDAPEMAFTIEALQVEWMGRGIVMVLPWARPKRR